eukprot:CAMPEP_0116012154 /NCGR_PEP_ID=MMETSP0321-20121206/4965_1 /TAXON_ID=163516 /ORGANISM="Leptocylindrus danicus var. danicus, Strain B650" /LENGTH=533 /DNA_ID=CAMNT_0003481465 /DNA_START=1 /DNA_END=1603 /DNA_ORIENTATION=-
MSSKYKEQGWIVELEDAKKKAKKVSEQLSMTRPLHDADNEDDIEDDDNEPLMQQSSTLQPSSPTSVEHNIDKLVARRFKAQCRIARAYHQLRQFQACKIAVAVCFSLNHSINRKDRERLEEYRADADAHLQEAAARSNMIMNNDRRREFKRGFFAIDEFSFPHPEIRNIYLLHACVLAGDVISLEEVVAFGASLDRPMVDREWCKRYTLHQSMPVDNTALVIACACLASATVVGRPSLPLDHYADCAVQLIMLGADVNRTLNLYSASRDGTNLLDIEPTHLPTWRKLKFAGKSAKELAILAKHTRVLEAMESMSTIEKKIANAHCRCGSRLKWSECHGAREVVGGGAYYCMKSVDPPRVCFRFSPVALCYCNQNFNLHYDCCWNSINLRPVYLDDVECKKGQYLNLTKKLGMFLRGGGKCSQESLDNVVATWLNFQNDFPPEQLGKTGLEKYPVEVYAGCISRLDDYFYWTNAHWKLEKSELLRRVQEWNEALESYCKDKGLDGEIGQEFLERHKVSPFALAAIVRVTGLRKG